MMRFSCEKEDREHGGEDTLSLPLFNVGVKMLVK